MMKMETDKTAEIPKPYAYLIDDSVVFPAWITYEEKWARHYAEHGKKVIPLFAKPEDVAAPGPAERMDSDAARRILHDRDAMRAINSLRRLVKAEPGMPLQEVVDLVAARLSAAEVIVNDYEDMIKLSGRTYDVEYKDPFSGQMKLNGAAVRVKVLNDLRKTFNPVDARVH
jgi:hypothetical protein